MEIRNIFGGNGGQKNVPIPLPNVTVRTGDDTGEWTPEQIRGILCDPIYAGISPFPASVSDDVWVRSAALLISEEGSEQFLVNPLFVGSAQESDEMPDWRWFQLYSLDSLRSLWPTPRPTAG